MPEFDKRIVHTIDAMAEVRVRSTIYLDRQQIDTYALPGAERRPVVFLVHGGPVPPEFPGATTWGVFRSWAELLAASGLVACVFDHRLHAISDYERSQADIAAAIAHVRAGDDGIDPERVAVWYFSGAGPQLSWLLRERPAYVRCAVALYAMLDLSHLLPADATPELRASAHAFSPATHLRGCTLPLFLARAGRDSPMVNVGLDAFLHAALANNIPFDLMNHAEGEHVFEVHSDTPRTHDIIRAAVAFTLRHLDPYSSDATNASASS